MPLTFNSIIITGASSGLGAELARQYAAPGVTLGLVARDTDRLAGIARECTERGAKVSCATIDVGDRDTLAAWIRGFNADSPVDLLVANAGITWPLPRRELYEPVAEIDRIMRTNFTGVINTVLPVIEEMRKVGKGHIAVISSLSAYRGIPSFPAYSASKAALFSYFEAVRGKLQLQGIGLSVICPGYIQTRMTERLPGIKLLVLPVDRAALKIRQGISKQKRLIVFPLLLRLGVWLTGILPAGINDLVYCRLFGISGR